MNPSFYTSGFLYRLKTKQILLLQTPIMSNTWSTIGGESRAGEGAELAFQRIVYRLLNIDLKINHIFPVYDYFHSIRNKINYVFYAEVGKTGVPNTPKGIFSWFTFQETAKLLFNPQTKQDIIVGERVINAKWRDNEAKLSGVVDG